MKKYNICFVSFFFILLFSGCSLFGDVSEKVGESVSNVKDNVEGKVDNIKNTVEGTVETVTDTYNETKKKVDDVSTAVSDLQESVDNLSEWGEEKEK